MLVIGRAFGANLLLSTDEASLLTREQPLQHRTRNNTAINVEYEQKQKTVKGVKPWSRIDAI